MTRRVVTVFATILVGLAPAMAASGGWLTGLNTGQVAIQDYELEAQSDMSLDDNDFSVRVFGGYTISYFAVTMGYVDLGALEASGSAFGGFTDKIEADGVDILGHGLLPLGKRFHLFGTLGAIRWSQKVTYSDSFEDFQGRASGVSLSYGAGADFLITPRGDWILHAEWTTYKDIGDLDVTGHENDRDLFSAGFVYRFGL